MARIPSDPRVRTHRAAELRQQKGVLAKAVHDGRTDVADEARRTMDVYLAERSLISVAPVLTDAERAHFASIALGAWREALANDPPTSQPAAARRIADVLAGGESVA